MSVRVRKKYTRHNEEEGWREGTRSRAQRNGSEEKSQQTAGYYLIGRGVRVRVCVCVRVWRLYLYSGIFSAKPKSPTTAEHAPFSQHTRQFCTQNKYNTRHADHDLALTLQLETRVCVCVRVRVHFLIRASSFERVVCTSSHSRFIF